MSIVVPTSGNAQVSPSQTTNSPAINTSGLLSGNAPTVDNYSNGFLGIGNNANKVAQQQAAYNNWFNDQEAVKNRD